MSFFPFKVTVLQCLFLSAMCLLTACAGQVEEPNSESLSTQLSSQVDDANLENFIPDTNRPGTTLVYECSDLDVIARTGPGEMAVWFDDRYLVLSQVRSASGSKYEGDGVLFWSKGDELLLEIGSRRYSDCELKPMRAPWEDARRRGIDFRAVGNEPGWYMEVRNDEHLLYVGDYGARKVFLENPQLEVKGDTRSYTANSKTDSITVTITSLSCHDTMKGNAYPKTVELSYNGRFYQGCGMLLDHPWE